MSFLPDQWYLLTVLYGNRIVFQRGVLCTVLSLLFILASASAGYGFLSRRHGNTAANIRSYIVVLVFALLLQLLAAVCGIYGCVQIADGYEYNWLFGFSLGMYTAVDVACTVTKLHSNTLQSVIHTVIGIVCVFYLHTACVRLITASSAGAGAELDIAFVCCTLAGMTLLHANNCKQASKPAIQVADSDILQLDVPLLSGDHGALEQQHAAYSHDSTWQRIALSHLNPLLDTGAARQLQLADIPQLPPALDTTRAMRQFQESTQMSTDYAGVAPACGKRKLLASLWHLFGKQWMYLGVLQAVIVALSFAGPLCLNQLLAYLQSAPGDGTALRGFGWAAAMAISSVASALVSTLMNVTAVNIQLKLRAGITGGVFTSMILGPIRQRTGLTNGIVTNLVTVDVQKLMDAVTSIHQFWSLPVQVIVTLVLLYVQVKFAFLAGLAVLCAFVPLNIYISKRIGTLTGDMMRHRDIRLKLTNESLLHIRTVKMYAWETPLLERISIARGLEYQALKSRKYLDAICVLLWASTPLLVPLATVSALVLSGSAGILDASTMFTTVALLGLLIFPLNAYAWVVTGILEAKVSFSRLSAFFHDQTPISVGKASAAFAALPDGVVCILRGSFGHATADMVSVEEIVQIPKSISISRGETVLVTGAVGAGKSSLLRSICGELRTSQVPLPISELCKISYAPQVPWIITGSVRENILGSEELDMQRLDRVVRACCLQEDIQQMSAGFDTCISDATISGGQKARISLARALYCKSNLLVVDDPTAALDTNVGYKLLSQVFGRMPDGAATWNDFDTGIAGFCQADSKSAIVASHDDRMLAYATRCIAVEDGRVEQIEHAVRSMFACSISAKKVLPATDATDSANSELNDEVRAEGHIDRHVIKQFCKIVGLGVTMTVLVSLGFMQLSKSVSDWFLAIWADVTSQSTPPLDSDAEVVANLRNWEKTRLLLVYGMLVLANFLFTSLRAWSFAYAGLKACRHIHDQLLRSCLFAPLSFLEHHAVGRILNRLSTDQYSTDDTLPFQLNIFLAQLVGLCGTVIVLAYSTMGLFLFVCIPLGYAYFILQRRYRSSSRELKRLDSTTKSPIVSFLVEAVNGADVMRAGSLKDSAYIAKGGQQLVTLLDDNQRTSFFSSIATQWLGLRLQLIGACVLLLITFLAVVQRALSSGADAAQLDGGGRQILGGASSSSGATAGLAVSYAIPIVGALQGLINSFAETEKEMIAIERAMEFINIRPEAPPPPEETRNSVFALGTINSELQAESNGFAPSLGSIEIRNLSITYANRSRAALNDISLIVRSGERLGVAGRTGCGKSTLLNAIWRLVPWQTGSISIDGVDIRRRTLFDLRNELAVIPQHPLLFEASVRFNLDPWQAQSDANLLDVLNKAGLWTSTGTGKIVTLDDAVTGGGANFSIGERQLLCMCRALLKHTKILCIDEATASTDADTDHRISQLIDEHFQDATVIVIAHRASTLLNCNRVMILEDGKVVELGVPAELLRNSSSRFSDIIACSTIGPGSQSSVNTSDAL